MLDQPKDISLSNPDAPGTPDWSQLARTAYEASTTWLNSSRRSSWANSLRQFNSVHPAGSKYLASDYKYRSRLYRPKSRTAVRKAESTTAAAFFANDDIVSVRPQDDDDPKQLASAALNQELLQYRLTHTIPWFLTVIGARQDCEIMGICVSKQYWKYAERPSDPEEAPEAPEPPIPLAPPPPAAPQSGMAPPPGSALATPPAPMPDPTMAMDAGGDPTADAAQQESVKVDFDHPWVDLIPGENFRFDPGCDWRDPVRTSPYLIHIIPMYVIDVKEKVASGEWLDVGDGAIHAARSMDDDTTRRAREQGRQDSTQQDSGKPADYDIVWVHENFMRRDGEDYQYFTLGTQALLLTEPRPAKEVYFHEARPFVVGVSNVEAHKAYPASKLEMLRDLQAKANEIENLRMDNVKLSLQPRAKVRKGAGVDLNDLRTFMPGKTILMEKIDDVEWDRPPDVTTSAYAEQDRVNVDFDDLAGTFSSGSVQSNRQLNETVGGMAMLSQAAGSIGDYELHIFSSTWVEPVLRQIMKMEQHYETDEVILALAGQRAQLTQKFGLDHITDELLQQELTTKVNVGIGATNPQIKINNFLTGAKILGQIFGPAAAQGANFDEVTKEVFGNLGYRDGQRFFQAGFDPRVVQLQQGMQQLQQQLMQAKSGQPNQLDMMKAQTDAQAAQNSAQVEANEAQRAQLKLHQDHEFNMAKLTQDHQFRMADTQIKGGHLQLDAQRFGLERQERIVPLEIARQAGGSLDGIGQQISQQLLQVGSVLKGDIDQIGAQVAQIGQDMHDGLLHLANHLNAPKRVIMDDNGNPVGVQHVPGQGAPDIGTAFAQLGAPRQIQYDENGAVTGSGIAPAPQPDAGMPA